jgi:serine/threonine protein kinase
VEKVRVAHEAISALAYLHDNSIIHRDVKPDNIMMDANNSPILIDFSLCKVLAPMEEVSMETHTGNIGTACYISPECYNFEPYSYEADSYSIGVVLLELFQGELLTDTVGRDKAALVVVQKMVAELPANPFPDVLRKLLNSNGEERITCRAALSEPVFLKNNFAVPSVSRQFENALEWAHPSAREGDENLAPAPVGKKRGNGKVDAGKGGELGGQQQQLMARISAILGVERAQTLAAAKQ